MGQSEGWDQWFEDKKRASVLRTASSMKEMGKRETGNTEWGVSAAI